MYQKKHLINVLLLNLIREYDAFILLLLTVKCQDHYVDSGMRVF